MVHLLLLWRLKRDVFRRRVKNITWKNALLSVDESVEVRKEKIMPEEMQTDRNIWIYGNPDKTELGFPMPGDLKEYLRKDIFEKENGRYRYTQGKNADVIILSRDGLAYGHLDIDDKVMPTDMDRKAYPKVKFVYLVRHSSLCEQPVPLANLSLAGLRFGKRISEAEFQQLQQMAGAITEFRKTPPLP